MIKVTFHSREEKMACSINNVRKTSSYLGKSKSIFLLPFCIKINLRWIKY